MTDEYDVIVVGGGGSGLAAALRAAELGASALVLEKQPHLGGTTGIAVGTFSASGTSLQRLAGVDDNPADHAEDVAKFAAADIEARNNEPLRRCFLGQAAATFEWLRGLGLTFYGPNPEPPNRVPRMHNVVPGAKAYIAALQLAAQRRGAIIECGVAVAGFFREGNRIAGVRATAQSEPREYRARQAVVLAAGDYASGPDLIARYKGTAFESIEGINPHAAGDGHKLVLDAGGSLVNMDVTYGPELRFVPPPGRAFQQILPAGKWPARIMGGLFRLMPRRLRLAFIKRLLVTWQHPENRLFDDGAILVNARGDRFTDERQTPGREIAVAAQPGKIAYILLDRGLIDKYSAWPHFISTAPEIAYAYVRDYQRLRPDVTASAASLEALAALRGMDAGRLEQAVRESRLSAADSGRSQGQNWVLLGPVKAYFTTTEGGAAINDKMQVLDQTGTPIPGLYAVGQNGLGGLVLWSHGLHIAWAMTSGRLAAEAIRRAAS